MGKNVEGFRVVRGPDWKRGDDDGGEGHVGTVEVDNYNGTVTVQWDMGNTGTYLTGADNKYELRVIDSAPAGIRHEGKACVACQVPEIYGTVWLCHECSDVYICNSCYCFDHHDIQHPCKRVDSPGNEGFPVKKRSVSTKIRSMGIFVGSTVKRREDVGSAAELGVVSEVIALEEKGGQRDAVIITWPDNTTSTCRVGFQGKVDLVCVEEMPGLEYYRDHLSLLYTNSKSVPPSTNEHRTDRAQVKHKTASTKPKLQVGDKVCVDVPEATIKELQSGHGGWNKEMNRYIGKYGVLKHIEKNGDYVIDYSDTKFRLNPDAVRKVQTLKFGDKVKIMADSQTVRLLQEAHGGWSNEYAETLGKVGQVVKIDSDGDVAVEFGDTAFVFNAACCEPVNEPKADRLDSDSSTGSQPKQNINDGKRRKRDGINTSHGVSGGQIERANPLAASLEDGLRGMQELLQNLANLSQGLMHDLLNPSAVNMGTMLLMNAAATNNIAMLHHVLQNNPELVNTKQQGLTALIIASHEGHKRVVDVLLAAGADANITDDTGHTALMTAASRNREDVAMILIRSGADINLRNKLGQSALHFCAIGQANDVLKELLQQTPDLNGQDAIRGDTPLHLAVSAENTEGALCLIANPNTKLDIPSKSGHTALTLAAMKGNVSIVKSILERSPDLAVSHKPVDGYSALHVAAVNDAAAVIEILLQYNAEVNKRSSQDFVPLHLSCKEGYIKSSKLLIEAGTNVNAQDTEGNSPLHLCVSQMRTGAPLIHMLLRRGEKLTKEVNERTELGCLLINHDASVQITNKAGHLPFQICRHVHMKDVLQTCSEMKTTRGRRVSSNVGIPPRGRETNMFLQIFSRTPVHCVSCMERLADTELTRNTCSHQAVCGACAIGLSACPVCGDTIEACLDRDENKVTGQSHRRDSDTCSIC